VINALGAVVTAIVDVVIIITKSPRGAWVVVVLIPALVLACWAIHRYYTNVRWMVSRIGTPTDALKLGAPSGSRRPCSASRRSAWPT
jgi:hypothetical protein